MMRYLTLHEVLILYCRIIEKRTLFFRERKNLLDSSGCAYFVQASE